MAKKEEEKEKDPKNTKPEVTPKSGTGGGPDPDKEEK